MTAPIVQSPGEEPGAEETTVTEATAGGLSVEPAPVQRPTVPEQKAEAEAAVDSEAVAKKLAGEAFDRLKKCKSEWEAVAGKARKKLWALLASTFVFHQRSVAIPELRDVVIDTVKNMPAYSNGEFKPETKSMLDLLIFYAVGSERETASSRSQYATCLENAIADPNVEPTEKAFLAWLKRKGGIVDSIGKPKKQDAELEGVVVSFSFEKFKDHMAKVPRRQAVNVEVDPSKDVFEGFTVLFASWDPDGLQLIEQIGDESVIRSVAAAVARQKVKNLSSEQKAQLRRDQQLWALNRVALKLGNKLSGNVTWDDADKWLLAHINLQGEDTEKHYFEGLAHAKFRDPSGADNLQVDTVNGDFHVLDPGRYIPFAKKGKLAPYDLDAVGTPQGDAELRRYIDKHRDPYIYTDSPHVSADVASTPSSLALSGPAPFKALPAPAEATAQETEEVE